MELCALQNILICIHCIFDGPRYAECHTRNINVSYLEQMCLRKFHFITNYQTKLVSDFRINVKELYEQYKKFLLPKRCSYVCQLRNLCYCMQAYSMYSRGNHFKLPYMQENVNQNLLFEQDLCKFQSTAHLVRMMYFTTD